MEFSAGNVSPCQPWQWNVPFFYVLVRICQKVCVCVQIKWTAGYKSTDASTSRRALLYKKKNFFFFQLVPLSGSSYILYLQIYGIACAKPRFTKKKKRSLILFWCGSPRQMIWLAAKRGDIYSQTTLVWTHDCSPPFCFLRVILHSTCSLIHTRLLDWSI